jgi:hypothetical protein
VLHELDGEAAIRAFVIADTQAFNEEAGFDAEGLGAGDDVGTEIVFHKFPV